MHKVREMLWGEATENGLGNFLKILCKFVYISTPKELQFSISLSLSHASTFRLAQNQSWMSLSVINLTGIWRDVWSSYTKFKDGRDYCINVSPCLPPSWWLLCSGNKIIAVVLEERLKNPSHSKFLFWIVFFDPFQFFQCGRILWWCGYLAFVKQKMPAFMKWVKYLSFVYYGFRLLQKIQYSSDQMFNCDTTSGCESIANARALQGLPLDSGVQEAWVLVLMAVGYHLISYLCLRRIWWKPTINEEGRSTNKIDSIV